MSFACGADLVGLVPVRPLTPSSPCPAGTKNSNPRSKPSDTRSTRRPIPSSSSTSTKNTVKISYITFEENSV